jgi:hypothetical protein
MADNARVILRTVRHVALAAAAALLLAACRFMSGPLISGYRTITIDPTTQRIDWQDPIQSEFVDADGRTRPVLGSYYQLWTGPGGGTSVDHFFRRDPETPPFRYGFLGTRDHLIYQSENWREILRGPFGTVYSQKTCFFNRPIETWGNLLVVSLYGNSRGEPPTMSDEPPATGPATLTNVSVIRVLRGGPEYIVAVALYGADGRARGLSVEGGRNADWVPGGKASIPEPNLTGGDQAAVMTSFGFPETVSIARALTQRPIGLATPSRGPVERDAISLHYSYDRWLRQDEYLVAGEHHTRYLTYVRTPEDVALHEACAERFRAREAILPRPFLLP